MGSAGTLSSGSNIKGLSRIFHRGSANDRDKCVYYEWWIHNKRSAPRCVDSRMNRPQQSARLSGCVVASRRASRQFPLSVGVDFNCMRANIRLMENSCQGAWQTESKYTIAAWSDALQTLMWGAATEEHIGTLSVLIRTLITWHEARNNGSKNYRYEKKASHSQLLSRVLAASLSSLYTLMDTHRCD